MLAQPSAFDSLRIPPAIAGICYRMVAVRRPLHATAFLGVTVHNAFELASGVGLMFQPELGLPGASAMWLVTFPALLAGALRGGRRCGSLFGYTKLYGHVPGGQAEYLRVPQAQFGPITVPDGPSDDRFVYLSDILPTGWQAARFAEVPRGGSVAVYGLGPVGQFSARSARIMGAERVFGVDMIPERLDMARRHGIEVVDAREVDDVPGYLADKTEGRGPDSVIDAVGMEAHGNRFAKLGQNIAAKLPGSIGEPVAEKFGLDRLAGLIDSINTVRRGGTVSIIGVYGGAVDPLPMMDMFDKGVQLRMGQCHVRRWIDEIMPYLVDDSDPLGTEDMASHYLPIEQAPHGYDIFQKKSDGCTKVILQPGRTEAQVQPGGRGRKAA